MPTTIQVLNRYKSDDPVVGAAITFDYDKIDAKTPRTGASGLATVRTEGLVDGTHLMRITPPYTSQLQVGPDVAEDVPSSVARMYRSLEALMEVKNGRVQAVYAVAGQQDNGDVGPGTNPVRATLQPIFFKGLHQIPNGRKHEDITLIVVHQTAGGTNMDGTLSHFNNPYKDEPTKRGSSHYVISAEANPKVVKVVQDVGLAGHAGTTDQTWWAGKKGVNNYSIGIELSHKAKTPWPPAQLGALLGLLQQLLHAYPSIKSDRIVGHTDVLLIDRDCPGLEFDWPLLEKFGLGLIPRDAPIAMDKAYGGFFQLQPAGQLRVGDHDSKRIWGGGKPWPAVPPPATGPAGENAGGPGSAAQSAPVAPTVTGGPIRELQTDLRDIGYFSPVDGSFAAATEFAVTRFQKHFFSGTRRGLIADNQRGKVDIATARLIKGVRP